MLDLRDLRPATCDLAVTSRWCVKAWHPRDETEKDRQKENRNLCPAVFFAKASFSRKTTFLVGELDGDKVAETLEVQPIEVCLHNRDVELGTTSKQADTSPSASF